ncbi:site-specific DNA-methyltransferase, partial [Neisseria meningitidis]|nr:site-specific DNA-methyltransferase [Neisseria meningitidis]
SRIFLFEQRCIRRTFVQTFCYHANHAATACRGQTLAFDEIDRLFDAKAFSKFSRYTADGKQAVGEIKRHSDGTPAENLIIKGNNLIALHSLAKQFKGKVKLIYIDPPYYFVKKKQQDSFGYNTNFKLSTWLTFMKNRLSIAKNY